MSEVKILNKKEFMQQYVLNRANTVNIGIGQDAPGSAKTAKEAYIEGVCGKDGNNINQRN